MDASKAERALSNLEKKINKINNALNQNVNASNKANNAMTNSCKKTEKAVDSLTKKLGKLAKAYLGVMGARAVITTSDTITSAKNRLNNLPSGSQQSTQMSMDKMYASSQRSRMNYTDMMNNVSKSMTLAGDAFQNNIDNAIRFQEIMSKSYTIGGASAAEQSSSMYQLIQALGSGVLQGDELRSVREGAPIAYKEIEKFAQRVLNTDESLKDLASQGKITSDMVVAAMMNAGDSIDKAFENTDVTFAQVFNSLKNSTIKSFEPMFTMLSDGLQYLVDNGVVDGVTRVIQIIAQAVEFVFKVVGKVFTWFMDNWYWIQFIAYGVITAIIINLGIMATQAIIAGIKMFWAFLMGLSPLYQWILIISLIVAGFVWMAGAASNLCEFLYNLFMGLGVAIITIITIVLAVYLAAGILMMSIPMLIGLAILAVIAIVAAVFFKYTGEFVGCMYGFGAVVQAVCNNIGVHWENMCNSMGAWFWNAVADMLEGVEWLLNGINKIREALGKDAISVDGVRAKAESYASQPKQTRTDLSDAWNSGYSKGRAIGTEIHNDINAWGEKLKSFSLTDSLANSLGIDYLPGMGTNTNGYDVGGSYDPSEALKGIGDTADNTGKMADAMELTSEDLEYLRRVADMEWKKEFTTANITVDMSNYNTINGNDDLDGIVTRLTDKLYEELDAVANGVYV